MPGTRLHACGKDLYSPRLFKNLIAAWRKLWPSLWNKENFPDDSYTVSLTKFIRIIEQNWRPEAGKWGWGGFGWWPGEKWDVQLTLKFQMTMHHFFSGSMPRAIFGTDFQKNFHCSPEIQSWRSTLFFKFVWLNLAPPKGSADDHREPTTCVCYPEAPNTLAHLLLLETQWGRGPANNLQGHISSKIYGDLYQAARHIYLMGVERKINTSKAETILHGWLYTCLFLKTIKKIRLLRTAYYSSKCWRMCLAFRQEEALSDKWVHYIDETSSLQAVMRSPRREGSGTFRVTLIPLNSGG